MGKKTFSLKRKKPSAIAPHAKLYNLQEPRKKVLCFPNKQTNKETHMLNWNSILRQSFLDLFGLLGGILIMLFLLYNAVHSPALEHIILFVLNAFVAGGEQQHAKGGLEQMILTPISILRHVTQRATEDSGSLWLGVVILAIAFIGAALDFVAGNFCRQLAVAVGVRLDALEQLNADWDLAAASAGTKGSTGSVAPPIIPLVDENGRPQQQPNQQQQQVRNPHHVLDADSVRRFDHTQGRPGKNSAKKMG